MTRHASAEDLASLDLDALRSRKAARIRHHVAGCVRCTQLSGQVAAVPATLASVSYPAMPASFATQLDTALASESASRLASAPATEAGRRDLPERRPRRPRGGRRLPGISVLATRLVAGAAALVVIGVGSYQLAAHSGNSVGGTSASSAGSASVPSARQLSLGPTVQYGQASGTETVQTVRSSSNFTAADLGAQALGAVEAAKLQGANGAHPAAATPAATAAGGSAPTNSASSKSFRSNQAAPTSTSGLASCLDGLVGSQPVQLVEIAKFNGAPATIIVTKQTATRPAQVWAVGPDCSASHSDVKAHQTLSGT
jgi:hypothetical protein